MTAGEGFDFGVDAEEPMTDDEAQARRDDALYQKALTNERHRRRAQAQVRAEEAAARLAEAPEPAPVMTIEHAAEYYRDVAGRELIEGVLPAKGIGTIFGGSGGGKTLVVILRSLCLASGSRFMERRVLEPVATLLVVFEGEHELHLRAAAAALRHSLPTRGVYILPVPPLSTDDESVARFISGPLAAAQKLAEADGLRLGVVVFDTVRGLVTGSLNDDDITLAVTRLLKAVAEAIGGLAEVVTHSPHTDATRATGSVEQRASRDVEWRVAPGVVSLAKSKSRRDGINIGCFKIESVMTPLSPNDVGVAVPITDLEAAVAATTPDGRSILDEAEKATLKDQLTAREILRLCQAPAEDKKGKPLDGWSNAMVNRALSGLRGRATDPLEVHQHASYVTPILEQLERQALIEDRAVSRKTGHPRAWVTTTAGSAVLDAAS